jgi:GntR family carbon starvation induced transcriptional regulator
MLNRSKTSKTQSEWLVEALHLDIVSGSLKPGDRLGMVSLQERYGAGVSPLREALSRLTSLGLVKSEGQRGFRVADVSAEDFTDLVKTMVWIEATALRAAIAQGDRNWEANVLAAAHRLGISVIGLNSERLFDEEWEERHDQFHLALVSACGSVRLLHYRTILYESIKRYRLRSAFYGTRDIDLEHRKLLDAALSRDVDRVLQLNEEHLVNLSSLLWAADPDHSERAEELTQLLRQKIKAGAAPQQPGAPI